MAALVQTFSRQFSTAEVETLKTLITMSAAGLFVSVLCATYGMDLSPGFF
jgi:hypothetical protein